MEKTFTGTVGGTVTIVPGTSIATRHRSLLRLLLSAVLLTSLFGVQAQDVVIDRNGQKYTGRITSEDSSRIEMQYEQGGRITDTTFQKSDVRIRNYSVAFDRSIAGVEDKNAVTIGLGVGGTTILGIEYERIILAKRFGIQIGGGMNGASFGLNVHFFPTIRSSYASLQYWYTGFGNYHSYWFGHRYMAVGPSVTWRAPKYFTASAGVGYIFDKGSALPDYADDFPIDVKLSVGLCLPF